MKLYRKSLIALPFVLLFLFLSVLNPVTYGAPVVQDPEHESFNSFPVRGFHIDLRIQVMTMPALRSFAKELADFGINTLVMEWEGSFPYEKHATISNKYAYSRQEIKDFVAYCDSLGIEVIPLQQCFGHVEYILQHDRYRDLRESDKDLSQVCPSKTEEDRKLFTDLFADIASLHKSKYIHIGGDETRLLGYCPVCSEKAAKEGKSKLFADYLVMICNIVTGMGKIPVLWSDIVLQYPEVVDRLPKETIYVDWNYGWKINHFGDIGKLLTKGLTFWGSPSIRSHPDNWYLTDWQKHFNNQRDFIPYARKAGYKGIVMTSWSTSGEYGYTWDTDNEVIKLHAIRNVYPLSGFRILVAAYAQSLRQDVPLDPKAFVVKYARERFGLTAAEGEKLWDILCASPEQVTPGDTADLERISRSVSHAEELMASLAPGAHMKEFEHLRLMLDLRLYYLDFMKIESVYESNRYNRETAKIILPELKRLLDESKSLNDRFADLNKGFLYPDEIKEQNHIRNEKLEEVYAAVAGLK
ncbi:MAG TPA: family 20 glycosylhydrolase [Bacteroidales bacterium]|nr:family 20 glycosylhydrolase [Bacteroidales bacterium]